ncbi:MAG TPA: type II secretion system protein GspM [Thermoleophilaceae bacterium]|nr:type II secretion system protein GspM [Thermoleophilaceae bacterium]
MTLSSRDKKIVLFLVPLVLIAAYWFLLLSPKREEATAASAKLTQEQDRLETARSAASSAGNAEDGFEASYATIVRLGKAIPPTVDMPSLLVQLEAAAEGTGIRFDTIAAGERTAAPAAAPAEGAPAEGGDTASTPAAEAGGAPAQTAPGGAVESANNAGQTSDQRNAAAEQSGVDATTSTTAGDGGLPVGGGAAGGTTAPAAAASPAGLETVPLSLEFEGNFFKLADFFHELKRFVRVANDDVLVSGRLVSVDSVRWASDTQIFPRIRAEVTATIYLSPLAQGVTAGATPAGPAPTTPASTPPAEAAPAPAPAAAPTATATP